MTAQNIPGSSQVDQLRALLAIKTGGGGGGSGATGATGPSGPTGAMGPAGATGATGPDGFQTLGPVRFIDPANSTGFASDSNTGATANNVPPGSGPILTTAHLNTLLFLRSLTADTVIEYMSDDTSGVGLLYGTMYLGAFNLTINQTPQTLHTGGDLNAGTVAINPTSNQRQVAHTTDVATFAPYVVAQLGGPASYAARIVDNTTTAGAWVVSATTPASPSCARPINPDGSAGALTISDPYKIQRGGVLQVAQQAAPTSNGGAVTFNDCAFTSASVGGPGASYNRCSFGGPLAVSGSLSDCFVQSDIVDNGTNIGALALSAGVLVTTGNSVWSPIIQMTGDVYITGVGLGLGGGFFQDVFIFSSAVGPGIQVQDATDAGAIAVYQPFSLSTGGGSTNPLLWGTGNLGVGILVNACQGLTVAATVPPTVTGSNGDFGFLGADGAGVVKLARAWNDSTGAYTEAGGVPTRATTWSNFAATIGSGGFAFQAHNVASAASLVGV